MRRARLKSNIPRDPEARAALGFVRLSGWLLVAVSVLIVGSVLNLGSLSASAGPARRLAAAATDPIIAAAGDIACTPGSSITSTKCHQSATSDLLSGATAVLTLGDNQYEDGTLAQYQGSFDPTWGRFKASMFPSVGNHEYHVAGAAGYFDYFGAAAGPRDRGYYSFDIGSWHLIAINSNCSAIGGCNAGSPQEQWLRADLAASAAQCTLAYWHHPRFSSGLHGSATFMQPIWQALYDFRADVVLSGHDHNYQRFALQTPSGVLDAARGIREFVVGTGGRSHYSPGATIANQEVANWTTFGVLKLTLHPTSYDWQFVPEAGQTFTDSGSAACVMDASGNQPPQITSDGGGASASLSKPENQTPVTDVNATDPDAGDTLTYSIAGGADAARFAIVASTGVLSFAAAPDFENPTDANADNVYQVTVQVSDGHGGSDQQALQATVTDVTENAAPLYFSPQNGTTVGGVTAANEDVLFWDGTAFSVAFDGSDVGIGSLQIDAFTWLDANTLLLSFDADKAVPGISGLVDDSDLVRFDATSLGANTAGSFSMYFDGSDVGLTASGHDVDAAELLSDGRILISTTASATVAGVTAQDEDLLAFTPTSLGENTAGGFSLYFDGSDVGLGAAGQDVDAVAVDALGRIYLSTLAAFAVPGLSGQPADVFVFTPSSLGPTTSGTYSPTPYFDGSAHGLDTNNVFAIDLPGAGAPGNSPPAITSDGGGASASLSKPENQTAVTDVNATDPDAGDTLSFSIADGADAARFAIVASTGVLSFASAPDFENPTDTNADNVYLVTVQVSDGNGGTDQQALSVTVTNVNEPPVISSDGGGASASLSKPENQTAVTDVNATDADAGDTLAYSIVGGADASRFAIVSSTGVVSFVSAPDFESPTDANADNVYLVTVQVADGNGGTDQQALSVTVTNVPEIAYDTATSATSASTGTTLSWSHTVASQSDRVLVVGVGAEHSSNACQASTVRYGSQSLTKITQSVAGTNPYDCASLWYLVAPNVGTNTITVTYQSSITNRTAGAVGVYNVKQAAPDASNSSFNNAGTTSTNVTTVAANSWVVDVFASGQAVGDLAAGSGQTNRWTRDSGSTHSSGMSTKAVATPGATSMTWTQTGINRSAAVVAAFAPVSA
jgi:calcineurin-like phosphoesterase family protein/cadherin domain-containing protein